MPVNKEQSIGEQIDIKGVFHGYKVEDENQFDWLERMALLSFRIDYARSPEDALLNYNFAPSAYERVARRHYAHIIDIVAKETGADPEQLADKDKRTPEQDRAILEAAGREQLMRIEATIQSNFYAALHYICAFDKDAENNEIPVNITLIAALYFFATHENIDPLKKNSLTDADGADVVAIYQRMNAFYFANADALDNEQAFIKAFAEAENPKRAKETFQRINALAVIPNSRITPNHKLVNTLTRATRTPEEAIEIIMTVCEMGRGKNKTAVTSSCILTYEGDNVKISGRQPFTEFDRNVYDAVCSLYAAGNRVFTSDMVWRAMLERTQQEQPTPAQKAAITKSIDKMRFMRAQIDCSDEFKARRVEIDGKNITGAGYDDNLLHLSVTWVTAGKNTIRAYEFPKESRFAPVLYQYSTAVKELITTPVGLLDIKKLDKKGKPTTRSVEYTERRVVINGYLRRRIEGMKGNNALKSRCIRFTDYEKNGQTHEGLYSVAGCPELSQPMPEGLTDAEKTKRKNDARYIREDAKLALDYWTAIGYIKGSMDYRDGKTVTGFEIALTQADLDAWKKADK